jgi:hypothetical protein
MNENICQFTLALSLTLSLFKSDMMQNINSLFDVIAEENFSLVVVAHHRKAFNKLLWRANKFEFL